MNRYLSLSCERVSPTRKMQQRRIISRVFNYWLLYAHGEHLQFVERVAYTLEERWTISVTIIIYWCCLIEQLNIRHKTLFTGMKLLLLVNPVILHNTSPITNSWGQQVIMRSNHFVVHYRAKVLQLLTSAVVSTTVVSTEEYKPLMNKCFK